MSKPKEDPLPEFGIDVKSVALDPKQRAWVHLYRTQHMRYKFPNWDAAETFMKELQRTQPHLELKVVPLEQWSPT